MKFLRQVRYEIRNVLKSRFLIIFALVLIGLGSVALPVVNLISSKAMNNNGPRPMPMYARDVAMKYGGYSGYGGVPGQDPIVIDGVTIAVDNPFYWNINDLTQQKLGLETDKSRFSTPEALDLAQELLDTELGYYVRFAKSITTQQDYRTDLAYRGTQSLYDKFIFEHLDKPTDVLLEAVSMRMGFDHDTFVAKYVNITAEQRQAAFVKADDALNQGYAIAENDDFAQYIALRIQQENDQIATLQDNIAIQEKAIVDNPSQEEQLNMMIEDMKRQIELIKTNNIWNLEYRLKKNIKPGENIWQNQALMDVEQNRNNVMYMKVLPQEQFNQDMGLQQQYTTYQKYKDTVQKQIDTYNNTIKIALNSLDAGKPDMKYVPDGLRYRITAYLDFSVLAAMFAVLLGGWVIASEFQQGTVRLLMIRPKTRTKILLAKFTSALTLSLAFYLAGTVLSALTNGICFGFSDLANPNYTINGPVGFFVDYLPKMLGSALPILFGFSIAFMLGVLVRNSAVSIAVPIVCFVGCVIALGMLMGRPSMSWVQYTPVPYVWLSSFFVPNSIVQQLTQYGGMTLSLPLGIGMLAALSAAAIFVSILVFRRRDITN